MSAHDDTTDPAHDGLTAAVARWVAGAVDAPLPPAVDHHVRRLLVDYAAGVVPASTTEVSRAVAAHVARNYPGDAATAIGLGRVSALGAAFLNGASAHGLEIDDGFTPGSVHPSSVSFPPVLAAAEELDASPDATRRALAVALELTCRLAAAGHPATWRNHFHNTPLAGVIGGACGVAVLLGLDEDRVRDAMGIAASHAGGLFAFLQEDAEVKRIHAGKASRDALASAQLAQLGVTGPRSVIEGSHGYIDAFTRGDFSAETLVAGLGARWRMLDTYVKPYPCCRHLHGPIDAVLALRSESGFDVDAIRAITVRTYGVASRHDGTRIEGLLDAQMSIPYAVAVAARDGVVGLAEFDEAHRDDPALHRLAAMTTVEADPGCDARYPSERPAIVDIELADGRRLERETAQPLGEPSNPLDDDEVTAKFVRLTSPQLGERAAEAAELLWAFRSPHVLAELQRMLDRA